MNRTWSPKNQNRVRFKLNKNGKHELRRGEKDDNDVVVSDPTETRKAEMSYPQRSMGERSRYYNKQDSEDELDEEYDAGNNLKQRIRNNYNEKEIEKKIRERINERIEDEIEKRISKSIEKKINRKINLKNKLPTTKKNYVHYEKYENCDSFNKKMESQLQKWLRLNSLKAKNLTLKKLISQATYSNPEVAPDTGQVHQCLQMQRSSVDAFQKELESAISDYSTMIKKYLSENNKYFGRVRGERVAVLLDASDDSFMNEHLLKTSLKNLLAHQLSLCKLLYLTSYSDQVDTLWKTPVRMNQSRYDEAEEWVEGLECGAGNDLLGGVKKILCDKVMRFELDLHDSKEDVYDGYDGNESPSSDMDTLVLIICSRPSQSLQDVLDYVEQKNLSYQLHLHLVSFQCSCPHVNKLLLSLAEECNGTYHCFNSDHDNMKLASSELQGLLKEVRGAQDLMTQINEIRSGYLGTAVVRLEDIGNSNNLDSTEAMDDLTFSLTFPTFSPLSLSLCPFKQFSVQKWLSANGVKAKGLGIYQVLAKDAFDIKETKLKITGSNIKGKVHEKAMVRVAWKGGIWKYVHVDVMGLRSYQEKLLCMQELLRKVETLLQNGSMRWFGNIFEERLKL